MISSSSRVRVLFLLLAAAFAALAPRSAWSCACGCGVFDVQTSGMLPNHAGLTTFVEDDYLDQGRNWSGTSQAPAEDNGDKRIRTHFMLAGAQYMASRSWGGALEVPVWNRYFKTTDGGGNPVSASRTGVGDVRLRALYTGFSPNLSTGLSLGLKLPTGDISAPGFDRDTEIGTGSTDLLLGAFHRSPVAMDSPVNWFAIGQWSEPVLVAAGYRPGRELDAVLGAYYDGLMFGRWSVAPLLQAVGSARWRDSGPAADAPDTGYTRLVLAAGFEIGAYDWRLYADAGVPVYQNVNGNQLVAASLWKLSLGRRF